MKTEHSHLLRMVMLAMLVAIGVVISPILRIEGMCPTAHFINIVCSVLLGPWYSLLCATLIGIIRMMMMGIPPLALTGAVFGAFFLPCYGNSYGKRRFNRILLYPNVFSCYDNGRNSCLVLLKNLKSGRCPCRVSKKSWSKSL